MEKRLQRGNREGANEHVFFIYDEHCNVNKCQWEVLVQGNIRSGLVHWAIMLGSKFVLDNCLWKKSGIFVYRGKVHILKMYAWKKSETVAVEGEIET